MEMDNLILNILLRATQLPGSCRFPYSDVSMISRPKLQPLPAARPSMYTQLSIDKLNQTET